MSNSYIQPVDPADLASRFSTEDTIEIIRPLDAEWAVPRLEKIKSVLEFLPPREADLIRLYFFADKRQMDIAAIFGITQAAVSYRIKRALKRIRFLVAMPEVSLEGVEEALQGVLKEDLDVQIFVHMYETTCQSKVAERLGLSQGRVRHRFLRKLRNIGEEVFELMFSWVDASDASHPQHANIRKMFEDLYQDSSISKMDDSEYEERFESILLHILEIEDFPENPHYLLSEIYRVFVRMKDNFTILHEVKLPKWSERPVNTLL